MSSPYNIVVKCRLYPQQEDDQLWIGFDNRYFVLIDRGPASSEWRLRIYSGDHPCEGYVFAAVAVTDGEGVYRFEDVPVASYEMSWQVDDTTWMSFVIGGFDIVVREGETTDLPDVDLAEQED